MSKYTVTFYLNTNLKKMEELNRLRATDYELNKELKILNQEDTPDKEKVKSLKKEIAGIEKPIAKLVPIRIGSGYQTEFIKHILEGTPKIYIYYFYADCREAVISGIRQILMAHAFVRHGTLNTSDGNDNPYQLRNLQIIIKNNRDTNLNEWGIKNMINFLTNILTQNERLLVNFTPDSIIIDCALWPIFISALLLIWRRSISYINSKSRYEKHTWSYRKEFIGFWTEQYANYLLGKASVISNFEQYWSFAGEFAVMGYSGVCSNLGRDADFSGPETYITDMLRGRYALARLEKQARVYAEGTKKEQDTSNALASVIAGYSQIYSFKRSIKNYLEGYDKSEGNILATSNLARLLTFLRTTIEKSGI